MPVSPLVRKSMIISQSPTAMQNRVELSHDDTNGKLESKKGDFNIPNNLILDKDIRVKGDIRLGDRYSLRWLAGQRGKPSLNADILNATEATRMIADPDFEILGTNASSDDSTFNAEGGITFTTDGADGDGVFLLPHLDANQTPWTQVTWGTDKSVRWECLITTGAAITN